MIKKMHTSNRKNGILLLDLSDIIQRYEQKHKLGGFLAVEKGTDRKVVVSQAWCFCF